MKKTSEGSGEQTMRPEYDFSKGVRGKYAGRMKNGYGVVIEHEDGSLTRKQYNGKREQISQQFIPAPPSEELRLMVPKEVMKKLRKKADFLGYSEANFFREVLRERAERTATIGVISKPAAKAAKRASSSNGTSNGTHRTKKTSVPARKKPQR